jgi:hypothetical protein
MALWSTQPLTEVSTMNLPWGKGRPARKTYKLNAVSEPIVQRNVGRLTTLWAFTDCYRVSFTFILAYRTA